jgi:hypothetical protein
MFDTRQHPPRERHPVLTRPLGGGFLDTADACSPLRLEERDGRAIRDRTNRADLGERE